SLCVCENQHRRTRGHYLVSSIRRSLAAANCMEESAAREHDANGFEVRLRNGHRDIVGLLVDRRERSRWPECRLLCERPARRRRLVGLAEQRVLPGIERRNQPPLCGEHERVFDYSEQQSMLDVHGTGVTLPESVRLTCFSMEENSHEQYHERVCSRFGKPVFRSHAWFFQNHGH